MRTILNNRLALWAVLAVPALLMMIAFAGGESDFADLLHPTGETSARLMIFAMILSPLAAVIGEPGWLRWLIARRRYFGVAAFLYALLHLVFYVIDMQTLADMLAEFTAPGIWTAWAAFVLMVPLAITSNDAAVRWLRSGWKRLQRLAYPAAVLTLLHWGFVHNGWAGALVHFAPLAVLMALRAARFGFYRRQGV
jgi:methionine sulfoxide reductase heme-binding subunit